MEIRFLTEDDAGSWADLLSVSFARQPAEMRQLWDWFHAGRELIVCGAWDGARLVAQYSSLLASLSVPHFPDPVWVGISTNMTVHPDYRGRGLIKQVASPVYLALADKRCIAGVGFSNAAGVKVDKHSQGYGYQVVGKMESKLLWLRGNRVKEGIYLTDHWSETSWDCPTLRDCIRFAVTPMSIYQRYGSHPFRKYRFGVWKREGKVVGVVVDRPLCRHGLCGSSLLAVYGQNLSELLGRWAGAIGASGAQFVHFLTTPNSPVWRAIKELGFCFPIPFNRSPYYLTVKPLYAGLCAPLLDFSRWDCLGGDIL